MKDDTKYIHAGYQPGDGDPRQLPIVQSTTYTFDSANSIAGVFDEPTHALIYSRFANPTVMAVEEKVAALEGGVAAMATSSGQAATLMAVLNLCSAGDSLVSSIEVYGGTANLFSVTLAKFGIEVIWVDPSAPEEEIAAAIKPNTKALFGETIANPLLSVLDIEKFARVAHGAGVPLIVDNTVPSPYLCRPFEHGADIVVHSLTKYLGGHGTSIGGIIVDSGKFPWGEHKERFKRLNEPDVSYHGVNYVEVLGAAAYIARARVVPLRNMGAAISPMNSFLILQGIETLPLRMDRICDNALTIARHLSRHPLVDWVEYAALEGNISKLLVDMYMGGRASGVLSFGIKTGAAGGAKFIDALQLVTRLVNIGDAKSLACHPGSTTHRQLSPEEQLKAGVRPEMIRLSIGIEHIDDLLEDIDQALAAAA